MTQVGRNISLVVSFEISSQLYFTQIKINPVSKHASKLSWSGAKESCVKCLCETEPEWIVQDVASYVPVVNAIENNFFLSAQ